MKPIRIVIHHEGGNNGFKAVNEWHKYLEFPKSKLGFYCGYTYYITKAGTIVQARTDLEEQAHTKGFNSDSIGICLAGDFNKEQPTTNQRHNLRQIIQKKMKEYDIPMDMVGSHRNYRDTTCCGINLTDGELKAMAIYKEPVEAVEMLKISLMERLVALLREYVSLLQKRLKLGVIPKGRYEDSKDML